MCAGVKAAHAIDVFVEGIDADVRSHPSKQGQKCRGQTNVPDLAQGRAGAQEHTDGCQEQKGNAHRSRDEFDSIQQIRIVFYAPPLHCGNARTNRLPASPIMLSR